MITIETMGRTIKIPTDEPGARVPVLVEGDEDGSLTFTLEDSYGDRGNTINLSSTSAFDILHALDANEITYEATNSYGEIDVDRLKQPEVKV